MTRKPAEVFHVVESLAEELEERGWSWADLARRMGKNKAEMFLYLTVLDHLRGRSPSYRLSADTACALERVLGVPAATWMNMDKSWRRWQTGGAIKGN